MARNIEDVLKAHREWLEHLEELIVRIGFIVGTIEAREALKDYKDKMDNL